MKLQPNRVKVKGKSQKKRGIKFDFRRQHSSEFPAVSFRDKVGVGTDRGREGERAQNIDNKRSDKNYA